MIEIVLLVILALSIVGGYLFSPRRRGAASRIRPAKRVELPTSEPADEGARIPEEEPPIPGAQPPKAA